MTIAEKQCQGLFCHRRATRELGGNVYCRTHYRSCLAAERRQNEFDLQRAKNELAEAADYLLTDMDTQPQQPSVDITAFRAAVKKYRKKLLEVGL